MTKPESRKYAKEKILSLANKIAEEEGILSNLEKILDGSKHILAYRADKWEVNMDPLVEKLGNTHKFYFPRVISEEEKTMEFVNPEGWKKGAYGLMEPLGVEIIQPEEADFCIVPALGFNKDGYRLGRGAGYYDRAFREINPKKMIGLTYSSLFSIDFSSSPYDIRVGRLLIGNQILIFHN